jgi:hypothetical protein
MICVKSSTPDVSMPSLKSVLLGMALILAAAPLVAGETVSNQKLGLHLSVPDGFVEVPDKVQGVVLFAFRRPALDGEKVGTFVLISRLGGVLSRDKIDPKVIVARAPHVTIVPEKWKDLEIEVSRVPERMGRLDVLTFNAQVPLEPEAIQISVLGEAAREDELRSVLRSLLGTLDGQTNWLSTQQRITRFAEGVAKLAIALAVLLFFGGLIWRAVRKRSRTDSEQDAAADRRRE